jgi:hypothetical protein
MKPTSFIDKDFCGQKLDAVIHLVKRLLADDYPHKDSKLGKFWNFTRVSEKF